jgi:hypothetical protein
MFWPIVIGIVVLLVVAFVVLVAYLVIADIRKEKQVRRDGEPVLADLVMANESLQDPDGDVELPGVVVFSFDEPTPRLQMALRNVAEECYELYTSDEMDSLDGADLEVAEIMKNHNYQEARRNRLPAAVAGEQGIYLADLWIKRDRLPDNLDEDRSLACMVTGQNEGKIILLPPDDPMAEKIYAAVSS